MMCWTLRAGPCSKRGAQWTSVWPSRYFKMNLVGYVRKLNRTSAVQMLIASIDCVCLEVIIARTGDTDTFGFVTRLHTMPCHEWNHGDVVDYDMCEPLRRGREKWWSRCDRET
jgi:hypothetical protein